MSGESRSSNTDVNGPIWPDFKLVWNFMLILVIFVWQYDQTWRSPRKHFLHYKSMRFGHYDNQFGTDLPLKLMLFFPYSIYILPMIVDLAWLGGLSDIPFWKCERRWAADGRRIYYQLTLWAFNTGELKWFKGCEIMCNNFSIVQVSA